MQNNFGDVTIIKENTTGGTGEMAYQALYREYRPKCFAQIVGQRHITSVLKNQVQLERATHAYLFCGPRGTGKTSIAKIFARALNCANPTEGEACGECEYCKIMREETVDIIEIDAASNTGVDDVRALIEQARFTPLKLKKKVYIIDETHMLSSAASNALLKTLEEPPEHVLFLLATTEPQRLLPTVISRCQRFDFKRISVADIVDTLSQILEKAGAEIEREGLLTIAANADGGLRDALSLAEQCLAFCGKKIRAEDVFDVLGVVGAQTLFDMTEALLKSDAARALNILEEIVRAGKDLTVFAQELSQHIRAVLLAKECGDCHELLECTQETMRLYQTQAEYASQMRLLRALELMAKAQADMKYIGRPRILLETAVVSICRPEDESTIVALIDRVDKLEKMLASYELKMKDEPPADTKEKATKKPVKKEQSQKKQADKEEKPEPTQSEESKKSAAILWQKLKDEIKSFNPSLHVVSFAVNGQRLQGETLTITFPQTKKSNYEMFMRHRDTLQAKLSQIDPGLTLSLELASLTPTNDDTANLKEVFGEKLKIT